MRTLIVDGQLLQTNAFYRGMGGFTFNLIHTYAASQPELRLIVVLNKNLTCDDERRAAIQDKIPTAELHLLDLPYQPKPATGEEDKARQALDMFIAQETTATDDVFYFIPALFLFDYCAVFPTDVKKVLLFHDLTPLIFREDMIKYFPGHLYFDRFKTIFEADIVLSNSQTTARDLEVYLGFSPKKIANIDGSLNMHPLEETTRVTTKKDLFERLNLNNAQYILMPTGGTEFKNNIRAAQALMRLKRTLSVDIKLVVTSFFRDIEKQELRLIAGPKDLIFTGNVSNDELTLLYESCTAVMLPSLYEGLGIPVLEGIIHDKPVACSDIPVFREIPHYREALYVFDPYDTEEIAEAMIAAIAQAGYSQKRTYYPEILEKYSWARSSRLFGEALQEQSFFKPVAQPKKRVAVVCPDPRKNNDVSVLAQRMYGYGLQAGIEFVYFIDPGGDDDITATVFPDYVRALALCYDIGRFYERTEVDKFDEIIYFLSGDVRFAQLIRAALSVPGYVYIGNEGYHETIARLAEYGMISEQQVAVEHQIYESTHRVHGFESPSLIASADGIIVEKHVAPKLAKTLKLYDLQVPTLTVPECSVVNFDAKAEQYQRDIYGQIFAFIGGKK